MADRVRWWALGVVCLAAFVVGVNLFVVSLALPSIAKDLHATTAQLQLIVDAYVVVYASLVVVGGGLGDRYGRVRFLRIGLLLFGSASAVAAFVSDPAALIACRALTGAGAAIILPTGLSIVTNVFPVPAERSRAISIWTAAGGLALALGPVVGGLVLSAFSWGSIFLLNVPFAIVGAVLAGRVIPESREPDPRRFDPLGAILAVAAISALVVTTVHAPKNGWGSTVTLLSYAGSVVLVASFVTWELRCSHAMVDLRSFRDRRFTSANAGQGAGNVAWAGVLFIVSQLLQFVYGYSAFTAGLSLVPMSIGLMLASYSSHRLTARFASRRVIAAALGAGAIAQGVLSLVGAHTPYPVVLVGLVLMAASYGLILASTTECAMSAVAPERAGVASGTVATTRQVGNAFGVALFGSLLVSGYHSVLDGREGALALSRAQFARARASVGDAVDLAPRLDGASRRALTDAVHEGFVHGMNLGMRVGAGLLVVAACFVLRWGREPRRAEQADGIAVEATGASLRGAPTTA